MPDPTLGEIRIFAGVRLPTDWMLCDGSALPIDTNQALFSLIGITYGGDGTKTFNLPDLRGRIMVGAGAGTGLSPYAPGQTGGQETVAMPPGAVPSHSHKVLAASSAANSQSPDGGSYGTVAADALLFTDTAKPLRTPPRQFQAEAVAASGGSPRPEPHDNMMPSVAINFMIAIQGVYPSK